VCVYHIAFQSLGQWFSSIGRNTEMPAYTQALYDARELALGRMQYDAQSAGATAGLVAVTVDESNHGWERHILEMIAMGTGVAPILDTAHETHDDARVVIGAQDN
jgi:uncharacterized protein YbjQ (UPF0145 family)